MLPKIHAYRFGRMEINGRAYAADLIIHPDGTIQDSWWRSQGHRLDAGDLENLLAEGVETIVVGTGASGLMRPAPGLAESLAAQGVRLLCQPTAQAVHTYNHLAEEGRRRLAGCFHLTC